jgi:SOS-response transcriptional repressor LexA
MDSLEPMTGAYREGKDIGTSVNVHAGFPNPAAERSGAPLNLDRLLIRHPNSTYFFRIRGHNWYRYGVFDGDLAIIDRAVNPKEGKLVVWWQESGDFMISTYEKSLQQNVWGTITTIIHPFMNEEQSV